MAGADYFDDIQKLYIAYYQRPADPGGLVYWAERLDAAGGNLNGIIEEFANSAESQALYGEINSETISDVVTDIYQALFGREPEPEGLNYYVNGFNEGTFTAGTIALDILNGAQNDDVLAIDNKVEAAMQFTQVLDPDLDALELQGTYEGDADAQAGREFLLQVTHDPTTQYTDTAVLEYIQNHIADPGDPILEQTTGQTFVLTTGQDDIPGTMGNDEVIGIIDATDATFTLGDVINGGAGDDTVTITTNQTGMNLGDVTLSAVEHFVVDARATNVGDIDVDSNALETFTIEGNGKTWTGGASVGNVNASTEMTFSDFDADGYNLDVYVNEESSAVNVAVNLTDVDNVDFELVLDDSADGTAPDDVVTFTLDGVKNSNNNTYIYTSDAETLNVVVAGDSAVEAIGDYYNNDGSDMGNTFVNLTLNGNLAVGFWDMNDSGGPTENTTFNITGAGDLYIDDLDDFDSNLTIAAGAATGDIEIYEIEPEAVSVTTGSGDDVIEIKNSATVVALNKGDDKVIVGSPITVDSTGPVDVVDADLDGGDNYDTLEITADNALTSETNVAASPDGLAVSDAFANFERLSLTSVAAVGTAAIDATAWGLGDDVVLDGAADFFTLTVNDAAKVEVTGDTGSPTSLVIDVDGAASAADNSLTLTINGANGIAVGTQIAEVETVNLVSTAADTDGAFNLFSMTAADLVTLNISGDVALSSFPSTDVFTALETVNAADFDAGLTIDVSSSAENVTITTGDGADYVIGSAQNDTISVGNGGNTVVGGLGLDTITLGSGVTENDFDAIGYNAVDESQGVTVDVIKGFQVNVQSTDDINGDTVVDGDDLINDVIDLSAVVMGTAVYSGEASGYGAVLTSLIGNATNSQAVLDVSTSTLYVDVNADAILDNNDMAITLTGVTDLSGANFAF